MKNFQRLFALLLMISFIFGCKSLSSIWLPPVSNDKQAFYSNTFLEESDLGYFLDSVISPNGIIWISGDINIYPEDGGSNKKNTQLWLLGIDPKKDKDAQIIYKRFFKNNYGSKAIAIAPDGTLWIAGNTSKKNYNDTFFIMGIDPKKNEDKQITYERYFEEGNGAAESILFDKKGILWLTGSKSSNQTSNKELWVMGLDPKKQKDKQIVYEEFFGGKIYDSGKAITISDDGIIWIAGDTHIKEDGNLFNVWLRVLGIDPQKGGKIVYDRRFGGDKKTGSSKAHSILVSSNGTLWIMGSLLGSPGDGDVPDAASIPVNALWLLEIDPKKRKDEQIIYNRYFGKAGIAVDYGKDMQLDENGIVWIAGKTYKSRMPLDPNSKSKECTWLLGVDPKKSEKNQIVYNSYLDIDTMKKPQLSPDYISKDIMETLQLEPCSIFIEKEKIWITGWASGMAIKKKFNPKAPMDRASSSVWVMGVER